MARDAIELNTSFEVLTIDQTDRKNQTVSVTCKSGLGNVIELKVEVIGSRVSIEAGKQGIIYRGKV